MVAHDGSRNDDELLESIGTAFSRLRRRTAGAPVDPPRAGTDFRRDLLLTVVEEAGGRLTVNGVAAELAMERTAASRLVTHSVARGFIERVASQTDGRSITLRLTPHGRDVLQDSRRQQRAAFEYITRDWSHDERMQLAALLHKYVASAGDVPDQGHPPATPVS